MHGPRRSLRWLVAALAITLGPACAATGCEENAPVEPADASLVEEYFGGDTASAETTPTVLTPRQIYAQSAEAIVLVETEHGAGTGFIVRSDGVIATCLHVIIGEEHARVILPDGRALVVEDVIATDPLLDLALIRVDAEDLPTLEVRTPPTVEAGERVVTIGHALGHPQPTVTDGLISAVRELPGAIVLQISIPIAQGTSGAPVLDERGRVVGIVSILTLLGQNLNFAASAQSLDSLIASSIDDPGEPLAEFAARTREETEAEEPPREIPVYPTTLLADCSQEQRAGIREHIESGLGVAANVYDAGEHEISYRLLEGTTLRILDETERCGDLRKQMRDELSHARATPGSTERAQILADMLVGVLRLLGRFAETS